jgi:chromosome segregation ATPase
MIDVVDRLHTIRAQLHTGAVGQREVWEKWLDEAADELHQLTGSKNALQAEIERLRGILDGTERRECEYLALIEKKHLLLQERNDEVARLRGSNTKLESENERLKAERHTTKRMLKDILDKHGYSGWDAARTLTED